MKQIDWATLKVRLKEGILVLPHFLKNPVQGMRTLPHWDWPTILILQAAFATSWAVLGNLIERDYHGIFTGFFILPITSVVLLGVAAGVFYYTFMFIYNREVPYRQIYQQLVFAAIPLQLTLMVESFFPPVLVIGGLAAMYLLFVGFTEGFHLERDKTKKMLIGLAAVAIVFWAAQFIKYTKLHDRQRLRATPESLEILENELKNDD